MSIHRSHIQMGSLYTGSIQANHNSRLQFGDNYYYGVQERLKHVAGALYDAYELGHRGCHPGTRRELLEDIGRWLDDPTGKGIFWLNGAAGTGKSTIAYTVAERLNQIGTASLTVLGASFFFRRGEGEQASAALFFPTVVHELRKKVPGLSVLIDGVVQVYPDICNKSLSEQFKRLILEPLSNLGISQQTSRYIIVVDALDECEKDDDIRVLLRLCSQMSLLGGGRLRLFLTSRPELPIRLGFSQMSSGVHQDFVLHTISEPVIKHDILVYLTDAFAQIRDEYNLEPLSGTPLAETWPGPGVLQELTKLAVPLFIIAATICRFVQDQDWDPQAQLSIVLESRRLGYKSHVARTYLPILQRMTSTTPDSVNRRQLYDEFRLIVGAVVTLFEPLSRNSLASLLGLRPEAIATRLRSLHSVLSVPLDPAEPIRPLHLSFGEFLASQEIQDQPFHVDNLAMHGMLAKKCLALLSREHPDGLYENMCQFDRPGQARRDVTHTEIQAHFTPSVQYACRYWVHHLLQNQYQICDDDEVHVFLQKHLLNWLEAMSLLDLLSEVVEQLWTLQSLISNSSHDSATISAYLEDARRFVLASLYTIDLAPLQVYSSALVFAPRESIVRRMYAEVSSWVVRYPVPPTGWNALIQTLEGHQDTIRALTFSNDGSTLASASDDTTARLWDAKTGRTRHTLDGHGAAFSVVAFSPDGTILAAGSQKIIWLWDVKTGQAKHSLEGHVSLILALSFTPRGLMLASVSYDAVVQLWDPETGQTRKTVGQRNDDSSIDVAAFSYEGLVLAQGSNEHLRLSNIRTGRTKMIPIGHTGNIIGLAFSTCGSILASVSDDMNMHLWDRRSSRIKHRLIGHTKLSSAVAISADASVLASASKDNTIWLWDTGTGEVKNTLEAHTKEVGALTFSSDGSMLASGSADTTIRLWEMKSSRAKFQLKGNMLRVLAVAFIPNTSTLVSVSIDMTVRLWYTDRGSHEIISTIRGTCCIVTFSPDFSLVALATPEGLIHTVRIPKHSSSSLPEQTPRNAKGQTIGESLRQIFGYAQDSSARVLRGHSKSVHAMAIHPYTWELASASDDGTVRLWDLHTGDHKVVLHGAQYIQQVTFSSDGEELFTDRGLIDVERMQLVSRESNHRPEIKHEAIMVKDEWVQYEGRNVLWLPHEYRSGVYAVRDGILAIGCESGLVGFFRIERPPQAVFKTG